MIIQTSGRVQAKTKTKINPEQIKMFYRKLYWISGDTDSIYASNLDGTHPVVVAHIDDLYTIAIHPVRR